MSVEKFIKPFHDGHRHPSGRFAKRAIDSAVAKLQEWRKPAEPVPVLPTQVEEGGLVNPDERLLFSGKSIRELQYPEGADQEITAWDRAWLEGIAKTNTYYNESVTFDDPRLKVD